MGLGWLFQISQSLAELVQSHCFNQIRLGCDHPSAIHFLDLVSTWPGGDRYFWLSFGFNSRRAMASRHFNNRKTLKCPDQHLLHCCFWQNLGRSDWAAPWTGCSALALEFLLADCSPSLYPHHPSGSTDVPSPLQSSSTWTPSPGLEAATVPSLPTESSKISEIQVRSFLFLLLFASSVEKSDFYFASFISERLISLISERQVIYLPLTLILLYTKRTHILMS